MNKRYDSKTGLYPLDKRNLKKVIADLMPIYKAATEEAVLLELEQLCKVTKGKSIFPTDESLLKMPYLATVDGRANAAGLYGGGSITGGKSCYSHRVFSRTHPSPPKRLYMEGQA